MSPSSWTARSRYPLIADLSLQDPASQPLDFVVSLDLQINITKGDVGKPVFWDPAGGWYLILNTAVGGGWPGPPSAATVFPALHAIDYVRVSQQQRAG